jgi:hypothetical protein
MILKLRMICFCPAPLHLLFPARCAIPSKNKTHTHTSFLTKLTLVAAELCRKQFKHFSESDLIKFKMPGIDVKVHRSGSWVWWYLLIIPAQRTVG